MMKLKLPQGSAVVRATGVLSLVVLSGCAAQRAPQQPMAQQPQVIHQQAAAPQQAAQPTPYQHMAQQYMQQQGNSYAVNTAYGNLTPAQNNQPSMVLYNQAIAEVDSLRERLRRAERAMIRLDRRMQLIEQSELKRMTSVEAEPAATSTALAPERQGQLTPMAFQNTQIDFAPRGNAGRSIVGTSQPAFQQQAAASRAAAPSSLNQLPSLADPVEQNQAEPGLTVWTVDYTAGKVWPSRAELMESTDLVAALRDGGSLALFARGANPSDRQFRDRVKALSQYLGQVADMDSVPIATIASDTLGADTIELFATR